MSNLKYGVLTPPHHHHHHELCVKVSYPRMGLLIQPSFMQTNESGSRKSPPLLEYYQGFICVRET